MFGGDFFTDIFVCPQIIIAIGSMKENHQYYITYRQNL